MQGRERPDIVVRVFKMKLLELLDDLIKHKVFGCVISYIYVIEFQKRGLPHCHILLTLDSSSKIRTKDVIDKFVSAELPNINVNRRLFEIVTKCMVHGPCGIINPNAPCMKDGELHKLRLKPGAIIMLLRNLAPSKGLCNGTRLIVIQLQKNVIVAKKISADNNNESYLIPQIPLIPSDSNMHFQFKRKQFPIRLAFSMTINKAQGQTFDKNLFRSNQTSF
ncbi:hypothetical protein AVEN_246552-1 [Araneus ventricosus]|uniref:Uncharacterized protein n=1 Tax=Araneus ventricosus TaxID=182803 RepID=A0A4Y2DDT0_ARAVE|nr:hypothetical protein AVEN_246552-1 [Araneus ventricosus]